MASYYKYAEKKVENEVNWGAISKGLTDSLTAEADSRVQRKAAIDKASDDDLKKMMDRPQGQYMAENSRISGFTEQAQKSQLASLRLLKSGAITEQEYNLRTNNLRTGTDMAFSLSQDYQDQYQIHMDRLKPDENGIIQASAGEPMMLGQLEQFGNPAESEYYVNPLTGEVQLAITAKEGESGQIKIKDGNFNLMSLNGAKNIIYQQLNRYQSDTVTTGIAEGIGKRIETLIGTNDKTGYFVTEEDAYKSLMGEDGELSTTPEAKALKDQINASFADDNARMSFLVDTLKTYDGTAYNLVYDESEQGGANILMKKNKQGSWEADIDAEQQVLIEKGMLGLIKNKLDKTQELKVDSRLMNQYQSAMLGLKRKELANAQAEKSDSMKVQVRSMGDLYSGDQVNVKAATEYFRDINSTVSLVERIPGGVEVTYTNAEGATVKRPVVFGIENTDFDASKPEGPNNTRFNMVQNTNFDATKPAGPNNQKLIPEIKTQREFMISAGNLLIGSDEAKKREFTEIVNSKNENGEFIFNENLSSEKASSAAEITEAPKQQKFDIAFDTYLDEKLEDEIFSKKEVKLKESLTKIFTDMGLNASPIGGSVSNEVLITVRGYTGDPLKIDGNNYTASGKAIEKEKLKKYLRLVFKQRPDLSDTLKINDTEGNQVFFTPDPVKKTKGFG